MTRVRSCPSSQLVRASPSESVTSLPRCSRTPRVQVRLRQQPHELQPFPHRMAFQLPAVQGQRLRAPRPRDHRLRVLARPVNSASSPSAAPALPSSFSATRSSAIQASTATVSVVRGPERHKESGRRPSRARTRAARVTPSTGPEVRQADCLRRHEISYGDIRQYVMTLRQRPTYPISTRIWYL